MTTKFKVSDASCGHCKSTVESAVSGLTDVTAAELDLGSNILTVHHAEKVDGDEISRAVRDAGYTPEPVV